MQNQKKTTSRDFCLYKKSGVRSHPYDWLSSVSFSSRRSVQPLKERCVFVIKGHIVYTVFHDSFFISRFIVDSRL